LTYINIGKSFYLGEEESEIERWGRGERERERERLREIEN
jgi:hypothetical protein